MGAIVSSSVAVSGPVQADGRQWWAETATDTLGAVYTGFYLAAPGTDTAAHLAATTAALETSLPANEIAANVAQISTAYPPIVTANFTTANETNDAVRDAYAGAVAVAATLLGAYLSGLSDADLATCFEFANPSAELTAIRNTVDAQLSLRNAGLVQRGQ